MGVIDYYGVGVGDVEARLYDGCGQKDIVVAIDKVQHNALQLGALHLSVGHHSADVGQQLGQHALQFQQVLDAVVDDKDLSATRSLWRRTWPSR